VNDAAKHDVVTGVSADGKTVLWQRRPTCVLPFTPYLADANFSPVILSDQPAFTGMATRAKSSLTLTADGFTVIGASVDGTRFLEATRPAIGNYVFGAASGTEFSVLAVTEPTQVDCPVISSDRLAFYFRVTDNPDPNKDGKYESVRESTKVPFPVAKKMPGRVQDFDEIIAVSSDRMTLFVQSETTGMAALSRKSLRDPFENPNFPGAAPKVPGFNTRPVGDCQALVGNQTNECPLSDIFDYTN